MKKIIATIATLLALSMAFVGCNTHAGDGTTDPKPDPAPEAPAVTPIELLKENIKDQANVISLEDLKGYAKDYNTITVTVKNENDEDRSTWGIVSLILTDAEAPWGWHGKVLGEGDYGQLPPAGEGNLEAGEEYTYEISLADLIAALEAEETKVDDGLKHRLTIQTGSNCPVTSVKLSAK